MKAPPAALLFVYGTLRRGGANHAHLKGQAFLGEARTVAGYSLYLLDGYPGMVPAADDTAGVIGELWEVDRACLAGLDELEGVAEGLYVRASIALQPPFENASAETYLYLRSLTGRTRLGPAWTG